MLPIVTPDEMREVDARASDSTDELIDRAGRRLARRARAMLGGSYGRRVIVIAGPGNNGADGRVCAQIMQRAGVGVSVVAPSERVLPPCDLVIDAAFGTGVNRGWEPPDVPAGVPVLAADIPSGVDGLTGEVRGGALKAALTVSFGALKPGLLLYPGSAYTGHVEIATLGLDTSRADRWLLTESDVRRALPPIVPDDHKWRRAVRVIGGSPGMSGAALLASTAALRAGAGYAHCVLAGSEHPTGLNEVVIGGGRSWESEVIEGLDRFGAVAIGPGLGRTDAAKRNVSWVLSACRSARPVVVDGDALRLIDRSTQLDPTVVLTPHDGEFTALAGTPPGPDRFAAARDLAGSTGATVLLKGPLTVVAAPGGHAIAVGHGDARLATAGTGDVLTGVIASLLAAGLEPTLAAATGAWIHADAARRCHRVGMVARDLLPTLADSVSEHTRGGDWGPSPG